MAKTPPPSPDDDDDLEWPEELPEGFEDLRAGQDGDEEEHGRAQSGSPVAHDRSPVAPRLDMPARSDKEEEIGQRLTRERAKQLDDEMRARLMRLSGIGVDFVVALVVMGGLGMAADYWLKTKPWLLLVGIGLGLVAGFYRFVRAATAANRDFRK